MLAITVFKLSLTIPPAMGISLAALNFSPFIARLSAPEVRIDCIDNMAEKAVKERPIIHRQLLLKNETMPERFVFLQKTLTAVIQQIAFTLGMISEAERI